MKMQTLLLIGAAGAILFLVMKGGNPLAKVEYGQANPVGGGQTTAGPQSLFDKIVAVVNTGVQLGQTVAQTAPRSN